MRILELLLLILVPGSGLWIYTSKKSDTKRERILLTLLSMLLVAHGVVEGLRLQMICVYLALPLLWFFSLTHKKILSKKLRIALTLLCLIGTLVALYLFPVNTMPTPTGPYTIGTVSYELIQQGREELYGPNPGEDRQIKFQVWYPADSTIGGERTYWLTEGRKVASGIPVMYNLPSFLLDHTALIKSHSYKNLAISTKEETYPLILISHGWTGFSSLHADLGEMLASHGYIALSINHTYGAAVSVFENGEVIYVDENALPARSSVDSFDRYSRPLVRTFAQDAQAVLGYMESNPLFADKIDTEKIGAIGHSTGGGAVVRLAITDPRIKAVLGLDAWVEPIEEDILTQGLHIPSAFLRSEQWETGPNNRFLQQLFTSTTVQPSIYQVQGGNHQDFSMLYLYLPITKILGLTGSLDPLKNAEIQQSFVLTFFDTILKHKPGDLQAWAKGYSAISEVTELK